MAMFVQRQIEYNCAICVPQSCHSFKSRILYIFINGNVGNILSSMCSAFNCSQRIYTNKVSKVIDLFANHDLQQ